MSWFWLASLRHSLRTQAERSGLLRHPSWLTEEDQAERMHWLLHQKLAEATNPAEIRHLLLKIPPGLRPAALAQVAGEARLWDARLTQEALLAGGASLWTSLAGNPALQAEALAPLLHRLSRALTRHAEEADFERGPSSFALALLATGLLLRSGRIERRSPLHRQALALVPPGSSLSPVWFDILAGHPEESAEAAEGALARVSPHQRARLLWDLCLRSSGAEIRRHWRRLLEQAPGAVSELFPRLSREQRSSLAPTDLLPLLGVDNAEWRLEVMRLLGRDVSPVAPAEVSPTPREREPRLHPPPSRRPSGR